jgi:hypothetical protein
MADPAAPAPGRRVSLGAAVVLAGFLVLAPPLYLLAPFALLTLFARPRTPREVLWLVLAAAGTAAVLTTGGELGPQVIQESGFVLAVFFLLLSARARGPLFPWALAAVVLTAMVFLAWGWRSGIGWSDVERAFAAMLKSGYETVVELGGQDAASRRELQTLIQPLLETAPRIARVMPGLLALQGLAGTLLASWWHHQIAAVPLGPRPARFRDFRFNDHLIWGAIFSLGLLLAPLRDEARAAVVNLLIVWAGLYAGRGLAIVATVLAPAPGPFRFFVAALAFLLAPVALGASVTLGLADTWLDIRGRLNPPVPGGA